MKTEKAIINSYKLAETKQLFCKWLFYQKLVNNGENINLHLKELKKPTIININTNPDEENI